MARPYPVHEAKAELSEILRHVKRGRSVTISERGREIAQVVPVARAADLAARLAELERDGLIRRPVFQALVLALCAAAGCSLPLRDPGRRIRPEQAASEAPTTCDAAVGAPLFTGVFDTLPLSIASFDVLLTAPAARRPAAALDEQACRPPEGTATAPAPGGDLRGPFRAATTEMFVRIVDVTAPTVVLLHGLGDDELDGGWARAAMVVAGPKANVTWVRLPDHELPTIRSRLGPVEGETVRAALAHLVTTCHLTGPVAVWGMSWGGAIAAHVARADLDAHDRGENAIVGGVLLESPVLDLSKSIAALDGWSAWLDVATVRKVFRQILCRRTEPDLPAGQCAKRRKGLRFRTAAASWLQLSGRALDAELVRRSAIGLLPRIGRAMVATVLVASNDPVLPREPVEDLRELRAPVTIIETPRGGHAGYLAVCRPFMERVVADWLERVRKSWQPASSHLPLGGDR